MNDQNGTDDPRATPTEPTTPVESTTPTASATPARRTSPPVTQRLGQVLVVGIAVLFGIFAVFNSQPVDFNWVFGGTEVVQQGGDRVSGGVPLIILLVVAFVVGATVGRASTWRRTRQMKRELKAR